MSAPDLQAQLLSTRRELAAVRRALHERRAVQTRPASSCDTVRALSAVLQHTIPDALRELRGERDRLTRALGHARTELRTARLRYSAMRYNVWHIAQRGLSGFAPPEEILDQICEETHDSEDDRAWDEGEWVQWWGSLYLRIPKLEKKHHGPHGRSGFFCHHRLTQLGSCTIPGVPVGIRRTLSRPRRRRWSCSKYK
jgi:hypothetical protein